MTTLVALISLTCSAIGAVALLLSVISALRGRTARPWRDTAILLLMGLALWQAYLVNPVATTWLLYLCLPTALAAALVILFSGTPRSSAAETGEDPDRRSPAVALRLPHGGYREPDNQEHMQKRGLGERRIA